MSDDDKQRTARAQKAEETRERRLVEEAFGALISDGWWGFLYQLLRDDPREFNAVDWAGLLPEYQEASRALASEWDIATPAPNSDKRWKESRRFFEKRKDDQTRALAVLHLDNFIPAEEVFSLLDSIARDDADPRSRLGEHSDTLWCYPHFEDLPKYGLPDYEFEPFSRPERMVPVRFYTGLDPSDFDDDTDFWERQHAVYGQFLVGYQAVQAYKELETIRLSRLARLKQLANGVVEATGCLEADALAFLLSDRIFLLPRVRIVRSLRAPGELPWYKLGSVTIEAPYQTQLTIRVASTDIPAGEVFAAYRKACDKVKGTSLTTSRAERDALLLEFRSQTPELTWPKRWERWNGLDDRSRFSSVDSMKATWSTAKKRAESGKG